MSSVHIDVGLGTETEPALAHSADGVFRIVLLGDFGGRASRQEPRLLRDPLLIDPDNFEEVMERLSTGLHLPTEGAPLKLRFRELDDFHPDHILEAYPEAFRAAVAPPPATTPTPLPAKPFLGSLLDQMVEDAPEPAANGNSFGDAIERIVRPHLIPKPDPRQLAAAAQGDAARGTVMRAILSHPQFQALEAAWRSVFFLLQRIETGVELKLYLIDITREELLDAATSGLPLTREGWSAAACLHSFSPTEAECAALAGLAALARQAGGPLLAGMNPSLMGCASMADTPDPDDWKQPLSDADLRAWLELRSHPDARWLGLAMPRLLLRVPYGKSTSPVEGFEFEEMPRPPQHEAYLWGSPAVACACLLGQAFNARGWQLHPGLRNQLDGLPVHNYRIDGDPRMTPPAETWITDSMAERMLEQGVMPLASAKNSNAILLVRSQSIADPARPLAGPWA